jgi:hypothetical protein
MTADQQQQQLLAELRPLLGSLVVQVALAGATGSLTAVFTCAVQWHAMHGQG